MNRLITIIFLIFLTTSPAFSQKTCESILSLSAADQVLDQIERKYKDIRTLKANFKQVSKHLSLNVTEQSSGLMYSKTGFGSRWSYINPEVQDFIIKNNDLYLYQEFEEQLLIDKASKFLITDAPLRFIEGISDIREQFMLTKGCKTGKNEYLLSFKSKKNSALSEFILGVDATHLPVYSLIKDIEGNINEVYLSNLNINLSLNDKEILPKFPKGIDIIDKR